MRVGHASAHLLRIERRKALANLRGTLAQLHGAVILTGRNLVRRRVLLLHAAASGENAIAHAQRT